jgi:hypothetical protein
MEATYCSPQPCWHDIQIGKTSVDQAKQLLAADRQFTLTASKYSDITGWVSCWEPSALGHGCIGEGEVELQPPPDTFHLADAIYLFGYPIAATNCGSFGDFPSNVTFIYLQEHILIVVYSSWQRNIEVFDPSLIVNRILFSTNIDPSNAEDSARLFSRMGEHQYCGMAPLK